mgnify:FL=1
MLDEAVNPFSLTCNERGGVAMFWISVVALIMQAVQLIIQVADFLKENCKQK